MKLIGYKLKLTFLSGPMKDTSHEFDQYPIAFRDIPKCKELQAEISLDDDEFLITDTSGKDSLVINGKRGNRFHLKPSDVVTLNDVQFKVEWFPSETKKDTPRDEGALAMLKEKIQAHLPKDTPEHIIEEIFLEELKGYEKK